MKSKFLLRILSILIIFSLTVTLLAPVYATDNIDSLENSSSELENELSSLENELAALSEEISSISAQISETSEEIRQTKSELAIAKGQEEQQYKAMKRRIQYMYENGTSNFLHILFSSDSLADFINRAEIFSAINEYDQTQLKKLVETKESIAQKEETLAQKQENLYTLQEELNKKEAAINSKISSTSSELTEITQKLAAAREEAQKAQEELNQKVEPVIPPEPEKPATPEPEVPGSSDDSDSNESDNDDDCDISATASDIELFAALIECEAGSTDYEGMLAVASVVVNRMKHPSYPDTLRGVIYQAGQFTPAHNGKLDRVLERGVKDSCVQVAGDALGGKNNVGDCLNFRAASSGHTGTVIGDNVFF